MTTMSLPNSEKPRFGSTSTLVLVFLLCAVAWACQKPSEEPSKPDIAAQKDRQERSARANRLLIEAKMAEPADKPLRLGDVARVYGDLPAGAQALVTLTDWYLRQRPPQVGAAWQEIRQFAERDQLPVELVTSYSCLTQFVHDPKRLENLSPEQMTEYELVQKKALKAWITAADAAAESEPWAKEFAAILDRGSAHLYAKNWARADDIWAAADPLSDPISVSQKVSLLISRADMWRQRAGNLARSKELYLEAQSRLESIKTEKDRVVYGAYLDEQLKGLTSN